MTYLDEIEVPRWFITCQLSDRAKVLWLHLTLAKAEGRRLSIPEAMAHLNCSRASVDRALRELRRVGAAPDPVAADRVALPPDPPPSVCEPGERVEEENAPAPLSPPIAPPAPLSPGNRNGWPTTVDRKALTADERSAVVAVVDAFNSEAGANFTPGAWARGIVGRLRENPDMTVPELIAVVRATLTQPRPWWTGRPSPNIVFGSAAQFERCREQAAGPAPLTTREQLQARGMESLAGMLRQRDARALEEVNPS